MQKKELKMLKEEINRIISTRYLKAKLNFQNKVANLVNNPPEEKEGKEGLLNNPPEGKEEEEKEGLLNNSAEQKEGKEQRTLYKDWEDFNIPRKSDKTLYTRTRKTYTIKVEGIIHKYAFGLKIDGQNMVLKQCSYCTCDGISRYCYNKCYEKGSFLNNTLITVKRVCRNDNKQHDSDENRLNVEIHNACNDELRGWCLSTIETFKPLFLHYQEIIDEYYRDINGL